MEQEAARIPMAATPLSPSNRLEKSKNVMLKSMSPKAMIINK